MPKAPKTNRPTSTDRSEPYPPATMLRTTGLDAPHGTSAGSLERSSASPWTDAEDQMLMEARHKGLNWAAIATQHFPSKTSNACRKRHERLMDKRKSQDSWDVEVLAQAYMEVRERMWQILATRLSESWQAVEGKCMEKGLKTLQNASRSVARREKAMRNHPPESDDGSCLGDDIPIQHDHPHHRHHHTNHHNGGDVGREEPMPSYRGDDGHPLHHADVSVSSASSSYTPHRTFSTAATTPTSYAAIPAVSPGASDVLPPMQSLNDASPQNSSIPSIKSILHPPPVTTH